MIAFGISVTEPEVYERCAGLGLRLAAEPDSEILAHGSSGSVFRSYNMLLDRAKELENLEALVLIHQDAGVIQSDLAEKDTRGDRPTPRSRSWAAPARRDRRAQHRLVGRLGDLGVIHPPLRGAGRRRGPRPRLDPRRRRPPTRRSARSRPSMVSSSGSRRGRLLRGPGEGGDLAAAQLLVAVGESRPGHRAVPPGDVRMSIPPTQPTSATSGSASASLMFARGRDRLSPRPGGSGRTPPGSRGFSIRL